MTVTSQGRRAASVGASSAPDAASACSAAITDALDGLRTSGAPPRLLVMYASASYDAQGLSAGIDAAADGVPLIGCTTAGEIATAGPGEHGVVVVALGGEGLSAAVGLGLVDEGGLRQAGATAARCLESVEQRSHRVVLLLSDGLSGDQQEVVRGAYELG